jgi:hypothetical protein
MKDIVELANGPTVYVKEQRAEHLLCFVLQSATTVKRDSLLAFRFKNPTYENYS